MNMTMLVRLLFLSYIGYTLLASTHVVAYSVTAKRNRKAVVVGGGPVGLATALTLSNPPHCFDVTLLEQSVGDASVARYDPTKAYLYLVNPRGQVWMKNFPSSFEKLIERGAENSMGSFMVVPADPNKPLPKSKIERQEGKSVEGKIFTATNAVETDNDDKSYWIPRHQMILLLMEVIGEQEAARKKESNSVRGSIKLENGKKFHSIRCLGGDGHHQLVEVEAQDANSGKSMHYEADLVVGSDGVNSAVREYLAAEQTATRPESWLTDARHSFKAKKWASPASGLRMKVLQFPPKFPIPDSDGSVFHAEGWCTIRSVNTGPRNRLSLGILPVKDPTLVRPANVITRPTHDAWQFRNGKEAKQWFQKAFPRLNFDDLVDGDEWDRFVAAKGTTFPHCQYSQGLQVSSPDETCGVVLVGDAVHAFPPDIGQGINAGLSDVVALDRALRGYDIVSGEASKENNSAQPSLGSALKEYERVRLPEAKSLVRIARFGSPYQYRQSPIRDRIGRFFWILNSLPRVLLHKLSFGVIPPPMMMMIQNKRLTYRQVSRRDNITTAVMAALILGLSYAVRVIA